MPQANPIEWLPILMELGEKEVARILDRSPDARTALLQAHENFVAAEQEARNLRAEGHENDLPTE
jgi:hypothetical protein